MMKIGAIIQARMSSERLPGKVLQQIAGKPMLQYLLERLEHCEVLDGLVVATSVDESDTPITSFCQRYGVSCYRGDLNNVAGRFNDVLDSYGFDAFVRINGDSPLLDQRLVDKAVELFKQHEADLATNALVRSYPKG